MKMSVRDLAVAPVSTRRRIQPCALGWAFGPGSAQAGLGPVKLLAWAMGRAMGPGDRVWAGPKARLIADLELCQVFPIAKICH